MRLLSSVDPPVGVQAAAGGEALLAEVALVGPLPRVNSHVALKQARPVKYLAARVARQHSLGLGLAEAGDRG